MDEVDAEHRTFTFEPEDLDVLCESLWHSEQRADVPAEDHERLRALRERLNAARGRLSPDGPEGSET
jgi:hypothetical protein